MSAITESEYAARWRRDVETGPSRAVALWNAGADVEAIARELDRPVWIVRAWITRHREERMREHDRPERAP